MSTDSETRILRGCRVLVATGILAVVVIGLMAVWSALANLPSILGALLPVVLLLGGLLLIMGMAFGASPMKMLGGAGRSARRAATHGAQAAARGAAGGVRSGARAGARATTSAGGLSTTVTVRRFRVRSMTGEMVPCVQYGDLLGDEVRHGDYVQVEGRRTRDGHLVLSRVDVLQTPAGPTISVVRARDRSFRTAIAADRVCLVLGLAIGAAELYYLARLLW